ncbi:MAG: AAA family ATPase [Elusimicrobia bacterium]|jgi:ATP-dependent RNA/DNA helicase IGHMBP2|nr:AAA family ATPase [Elusimicrobiota bacterium]
MIDPDNHFNTLMDLLEMERDAEKEDNKRELDRWPVEMREQLGKTVARLSIERRDVGVGGLPLLVLSRMAQGETLSPFHAMDQGDLVRVTFLNGEFSKEGTLYHVEDYRVTVALNEELLEEPSGKCRIDLLGSDATYKRMRRALDIVLRQGGRLGELREILLGNESASMGALPEIHFLNDRLNDFQRDAVRSALAAQDIALIHGPPGTGKTTVLAEIIRQAVAKGKSVLATAPSNIAVDNMLEKLLDAGLNVVRLGHPARILENLRHATLMAQLDEHPDQKVIRLMDRDRERLVVQRYRGQGRLPIEEDKALKREIKALWKEARAIEKSISKRIIQKADVVLATHGGIGALLNSERFDVVCLDEASQATEPLSWIPILLAEKVVMAGDPLQLPPTIHSKEAADRGLKTTLMERLQPDLPENLQTLLRVQYRMNKEIMGFSSAQFYENKLVAHESVQDHSLLDIPHVSPTGLTGARLVFVDTAGTNFNETWNELMDSRENEGEARLVLKLWNELAEAGVKPHWAALISPYAAQVRHLRHQVPPGLEVGTVDGFQGREKEVILLSLVRSNDQGEVGFLSDTRRMNVAMTRARRLLVVVGDSATIGRHRFYEAFLDYVQTHGEHRSAWEWISQ